MSGDVQPRKRNKDNKNVKKKKDELDAKATAELIARKMSLKDDDSTTNFKDKPSSVLTSTASKIQTDDIQLHVHSEHGTGGHWCAKIVFFSLMAILAGLIGLILLENRGLSDLDTPLSESRFAEYLDGWVDEEREHSHDEHDVNKIIDDELNDHEHDNEPFAEEEDHDDDDDDDDDNDEEDDNGHEDDDDDGITKNVIDDAEDDTEQSEEVDGKDEEDDDDVDDEVNRTDNQNEDELSQEEIETTENLRFKLSGKYDNDADDDNDDEKDEGFDEGEDEIEHSDSVDTKEDNDMGNDDDNSDNVDYDNERNDITTDESNDNNDGDEDDNTPFDEHVTNKICVNNNLSLCDDQNDPLVTTKDPMTIVHDSLASDQQPPSPTTVPMTIADELEKQLDDHIENVNRVAESLNKPNLVINLNNVDKVSTSDELETNDYTNDELVKYWNEIHKSNEHNFTDLPDWNDRSTDIYPDVKLPDYNVSEGISHLDVEKRSIIESDDEDEDDDDEVSFEQVVDNDEGEEMHLRNKAQKDNIIESVEEEEDVSEESGSQIKRSDGPQNMRDDYDDDDEIMTANNMLQDNPALAIELFESIIQKNPKSFEAMYGKALALDKLSEEHQSNVILDKAIEQYIQILNELGATIDDVKFKTVAEKCIERMRFKGQLMKAVSIHETLIERFNDDPFYRNQLAVTYLLSNKLADAKFVLHETLLRWREDGFACVHYGFVLKILDNNLEAAVSFLRQGIETNETGTQDGRFYFHLGDALNRLGRGQEAFEVYRLGVKNHLFLSEYQRSLYNVNRLKSKPFWSLNDTTITYQNDFRLLEINWEQIRDEGKRLLNDREQFFVDETENLRDRGDWKQFELYARGGKNSKNCQKTPFTCKMVEYFTAAQSCTRGQIKFSVMHPGTHVWPHCGPTNCRLRAHLGLIVPKNTFIRVANETRTWEDGKLLIFDDSFEHEVWHNGTSVRLVLIIDVWHPDLTEAERKSLTPI